MYKSEIYFLREIFCNIHLSIIPNLPLPTVDRDRTHVHEDRHYIREASATDGEGYPTFAVRCRQDDG